VISAVIDFFRSITFADIVAGFNTILRGIFLEFPLLLWDGIKALGRGIHATLLAFFGTVYWVGFWIMYGIGWVVTFVPRRVWEIIVSIGGGIATAFKEVWIWISPKSMA
jgi:hypothetical protein